MIGKRWLYLVHRWLGVLLALVMVLWFVSGVVMMYVGYPKLTRAERLEASHVMQLGPDCCARPEALLAGLAAADGGLRSLRLATVGGQPRLIALSSSRELVVLDLSSAKPLSAAGGDEARIAARDFAPDAELLHVESVVEDAFTHSKAMDPFRPLFRVRVSHPTLESLYVSAVTGEVVRDLSVDEARWNWIGSWLHWLYIFRGGVFDKVWTEIVVYGAVLAGVLTALGLVVGVMRWRSRRYASGSHSPYRQALQRWHHLWGLAGGLLILAWVLSGLFSLNPWRMFDSGAKRPLESLIIPASHVEMFDVPGALNCLNERGFQAVELEWTPVAGALHILASDRAGQVWNLRDTKPCDARTRYEADELVALAKQRMPHASIVDARVQSSYDWHYYARAPHSMTGAFEKPLPVVVMRFDDEQETWLYLDMRTSRELKRTDQLGRLQRLLFNFFHSYDWHPLLEKRPVWDLLLIIGSLVGLFVSATGLVLGWRRVMRARGGPNV